MPRFIDHDIIDIIKDKRTTEEQKIQELINVVEEEIAEVSNREYDYGFEDGLEKFKDTGLEISELLNHFDNFAIEELNEKWKIEMKLRGIK